MDSRATEREILEWENKLLLPTAQQPVSLPLGFLRYITDDFSQERKIGSGGYGVVYKGILRYGLPIAVKKFGRIPTADDRSFENEASSLMAIKHDNVVQLLGFCTESRGAMMMKQPNGKYVVAEEQTRMPCFEYMCNRDLAEYLSDESSGLEWNTRYKIIKGICSGLKYLHECKIIHLDLKPQNILMDDIMMPKIADFGLSRLLGVQKSYTITITSNRAGTMGYMAPEYIDRGIISDKADIFSLGVIIIEILKGCRDYPDYRHSTEKDFQHFTEKVLNNWRDRLERAPKYTSLELHTQQVKQCIDIALECVHPDKEKRPNVSNIIEILNAAEGSCVQNGEDLLLDQQLQQVHDAALRIFMNEGQSWYGMKCHQPTTFDTLAMYPAFKRAIARDLDAFLNARDYYRLIGRVWKRAYLVHGPPGTDKSSLVASMANHIGFNLYELDLSSEVRSNSEVMQKLLIDMPNKSILVIDYDSFEGVASRERDDDGNGNGRAREPDMDAADYGSSDGSPPAASYGPPKGITLSGLLNSIDELLCTSGEARITVLTTNHIERHEPALLRSGRIDMMVGGYSGAAAVRTLNYFLVDEHPLFLPEVQELLSAVDVTPAEVSEVLCAARDAARQLIVEFLEKKRRTEGTE